MSNGDWGWWWKLLRNWLAWRLRGSKPNNGSLDACLKRLAGLLWRDAMELRRAGLRSRREAEKPVRRGPVKVVIVDLADWHAWNVGSRAG